jgi:hypothetical protein
VRSLRKTGADDSIDENTLFQVASMSKFIAAIAVTIWVLAQEAA